MSQLESDGNKFIQMYSMNRWTYTKERKLLKKHLSTFSNLPTNWLFSHANVISLFVSRFDEEVNGNKHQSDTRACKKWNHGLFLTYSQMT